MPASVCAVNHIVGSSLAEVLTCNPFGCHFGLFHISRGCWQLIPHNLSPVFCLLITSLLIHIFPTLPLCHFRAKLKFSRTKLHTTTAQFVCWSKGRAISLLFYEWGFKILKLQQLSSCQICTLIIASDVCMLSHIVSVVAVPCTFRSLSLISWLGAISSRDTYRQQCNFYRATLSNFSHVIWVSMGSTVTENLLTRKNVKCIPIVMLYVVSRYNYLR